MTVSVLHTAPLAAPASPSAVTGTATGDLTPGKTYYYRIAGIGGSFQPQGEPSVEVSAVADANGSIDLSWSVVTGANYYMVWRTPTSGDYEVSYNGGVNCDRDSHPMFLRKRNLYYSRTYTVSGNTTTALTDVGSETELPSGYSYYRWYFNRNLRPYGEHYINVTGGVSGGEASFDDIYADAVANGYDTTTFQKLYESPGGHRVFLCYGALKLDDYFAEVDCTIIATMGIYCGSSDTGLKTFGRISADGLYTYSGVNFVFVSPCGRQNYFTFQWLNAKFYGCRISRDWRDVAPYAEVYYIFAQGQNSATPNIYDDCEFIDTRFEDVCWQQLQLIGTSGIVFRRTEWLRHVRGINMARDQSGNTFDQMTVYGSTFTTTGRGGTLRDCTLINYANTYFRFYNVTGITRTLVDCTFDGDDDYLPVSATDGGTTYGGNKVIIAHRLDIEVTDKEGNPVAGADVVLVDAQGARLALTTAADGTIAQQELAEKEATRAAVGIGSFDTVTTMTPYALTISKHGFRTYATSVDLTERRALRPRLTRSPFTN